jgi:cephalosporin-C deacetylase-like acetyl esterase
MKKIPTLLWCLLAASGTAFGAAAPPAPAAAVEQKVEWSITADHANALYQPGETATFTVKLLDGAKVPPDGELFWRITKDGIAPTFNGTVKFTAGTGTITGKLDEPGFLQCVVSTEAGGKGQKAQWGVGYSPELLKPSLPVPDDFDAFWKRQLDKLAAVPINPSLTPANGGKVEAFDTKLDCVGAPVSGYFARPKGAKPKSLPAILLLHGAGVRSANLQSANGWASNNLLAMDINAHGIPNGKDEAFYKALIDGELKSYPMIGRGSREESYFVDMFLRAKRALDFLCSQPEWDGKNLIVFGGSQGGFQSFAAAALDERVTMMVANIPAGCDHSAMLAKRMFGWPRLVEKDASGKPDAAMLEASRYVDSVNFATRCKAKIARVSTGFIDTVCVPTSVYVAYNQIPVKDKKIYNDLGIGHRIAPETDREIRDLVFKQSEP